MKECYIRFRASVNPITSRDLLVLVDSKYRDGYSKIHLLISTPGGNVKDGIGIYNYLKSLPIEIYTYNIGSVDSIGIIIYCAGLKRYSVKHARFLIHPISVFINNMRFDEHLFNEQLNSLKIDHSNIAKIIADLINSSEEEILKKMHKRETLNPENAKSLGLVNEIKTDFLPIGKELIAIEDPPPQGQFNAPIVMQSPSNIPETSSDTSFMYKFGSKIKIGV